MRQPAPENRWCLGYGATNRSSVRSFTGQLASTWRLADFLTAKRVPELDEALEPHHLEVIAANQIEDRGRCCDRVQRIRAEFIAEGQRRGGEHHLYYDQDQRHNPHHQVDFHRLPSKRPGQFEAL